MSLFVIFGRLTKALSTYDVRGRRGAPEKQTKEFCPDEGGPLKNGQRNFFLCPFSGLGFFFKPIFVLYLVMYHQNCKTNSPAAGF